MIEKNKLKDLVKSYLPQTKDATVDNISDDIIRDAESIIHSMVRQAIAQERENLYLKKSKE